MEDNSLSQLGVNEPYLEQEFSPVLVDALLNFKPVQISCGQSHTLVRTKVGDTFAWGQNEYGQCGTTIGQKVAIVYQPTSVNFDQYYKPNIKGISAGGFHSGFVDDIGRLFICGRNDKGQLGLGSL